MAAPRVVDRREAARSRPAAAPPAGPRGGPSDLPRVAALKPLTGAHRGRVRTGARVGAPARRSGWDRSGARGGHAPVLPAPADNEPPARRSRYSTINVIELATPEQVLLIETFPRMCAVFALWNDHPSPAPTILQAATELGCSVSTLRRQFLKLGIDGHVLTPREVEALLDQYEHHAGQTRATAVLPVGAFLVEWGLRSSRLLIATTDLTMAEVANESGYLSEGNFSTEYRKRFGASPLAFRRAYANWLAAHGRERMWSSSKESCSSSKDRCTPSKDA